MMSVVACSNGANVGSDQPDASTRTTVSASGEQRSPEAETDSQEAMLNELLGPDVYEKLSGLQGAIDSYVEEAIVSCMANEGFEYIPRSKKVVAELKSGTGAQYFNFASSLLASLDFGMGIATHLNPNAQIYARLGESERDAWDSQHADCRVRLSAEHENPLASESGWFNQIYGDASARTANDKAVVTAEDAAVVCFEQATGFKTASEAAETTSDKVIELRSRQASGAVTDKQLRAALTPLIEREAELSEAYATCNSPLLEVQAVAFSRNLVAGVESNRDVAMLWAAEFGRKIKAYEKYYVGYDATLAGSDSRSRSTQSGESQ
ncbi:MAG: hypothetical protein ACSLFB_02965 [Acidimicrobiales bacterium]